MTQNTSLSKGPLLRVLIVLVLLFGLAAAWRWTPLALWINVDTITKWETSFKADPAAPVFVVAAYVLGSLVLVPLTLLTVSTVIVFGPVRGYAYALLGCVLSATVTYGIGRLLGRNVIHGIVGPRMEYLNQRAGRHGLITVVIIRMLLIAPFTIVNMMFGASHIRFRDFLVGTFLGMTPGLVGITLFGFQLENAVRAPGIGSFAVLAGLVALIVLGLILIRRWLANREEPTVTTSISGSANSD
jgi:phospholipase D1/2